MVYSEPRLISATSALVWHRWLFAPLLCISGLKVAAKALRQNASPAGSASSGHGSRRLRRALAYRLASFERALQEKLAAGRPASTVGGWPIPAL